MRILIDGMNLALTQGTGVATYARNLSYCIKTRDHHLSVLYGREMRPYRDPVLREATFFDGRDMGRSELDYYLDLARSLAPYTPVEIPETGAVMREEIAGRLPAADRFLNIRSLFFIAAAKFQLTGRLVEITPDQPVDVAHWTYPVPARIRGARNIYTMHDLVPLKLPYTTLDVKSRYLRMLRRLLRSADRIVTVSEHSRNDIIETLGADPDKVVNTYQSVNLPAQMLADDAAQVEIDLEAIDPMSTPQETGDDYAPAPRPQATTGRRVRRGEFYLYVGAIEPKKNLRRTIEAYLASGVAEPLVVVGRQAWAFDAEMKLIARGGGRIIYLDYAPFAQVVTLMRSARALVFASLYEGFGLPVLEAFLCGAPVITADASSTREIAGDAALLVDPHDVRDIRDAFRRLSADGSEDLRRDLAARGLKRAEAFDQAHIAARLDDLYRDVVAG